MKTLIRPILISLIGIALISYSSYKLGYNYGEVMGSGKTLDTINTIMAKQLAQDSLIVTKIGIEVKRDTLYYVLTRKDILDK